MSSLSKNARVAGLLCILSSAVGLVRLMYIPKALFVRGNAAATANNIAAHESLFRLGGEKRGRCHARQRMRTSR